MSIKGIATDARKWETMHAKNKGWGCRWVFVAIDELDIRAFVLFVVGGQELL
jgi:hypothetical protein